MVGHLSDLNLNVWQLYDCETSELWQELGLRAKVEMVSSMALTKAASSSSSSSSSANNLLAGHKRISDADSLYVWSYIVVNILIIFIGYNYNIFVITITYVKYFYIHYI